MNSFRHLSTPRQDGPRMGLTHTTPGHTVCSPLHSATHPNRLSTHSISRPPRRTPRMFPQQQSYLSFSRAPKPSTDVLPEPQRRRRMSYQSLNADRRMSDTPIQPSHAKPLVGLHGVSSIHATRPSMSLAEGADASARHPRDVCPLSPVNDSREETWTWKSLLGHSTTWRNTGPL